MNRRNKKPTAHLICGFIGAGKTTFSKKLEKETGALRFTKDEWLIRIIGNNPTIDNFDVYDQRMTDLVFDIAFRCLEAGNDIILDDGIWVKSQRKEIHDRVKKVGAIPKLYYLKISDDTRKERTIKRTENPPKDAFKIDETVYESYKKYFEAPTEDEEPIIIEMKF